MSDFSHDTADVSGRDHGILLSVVLPIYNEADAISELIDQLASILSTLNVRYEVICVNDGSIDDTRKILRTLKSKYPFMRILNLSRNFGKENALTAGLDHAAGDVVVTMDSDLQHNPELLTRMLEEWKDGYPVVYAQRVGRETDPLGRRVLSRIFYNVTNRLMTQSIPEGSGDFRLFDRKVVDALKLFRERNRFMKGLYVDVGFRAKAVPYRVLPRDSGESKFSLWRLWNFALDGITSFSTAPLRIWSYLGVLIATLAFIYAIYVMIQTFIYGVSVPGFATIVILILVFGGVQLISIGIIGEYLGRVYQETKRRPLYILDDTDAAESDSDT